MNIGRKIKGLRLERELTQEEIAKELKLTRSAYAGYENNYRKMPLEILVDIADLYDVSLDYLCDRREV